MTDTSICNTGNFPFNYYDSNGDIVDGTFDSAGSCIFPDAVCDPTKPTKDCCDANEEFTSNPGSNIMLICLALAFLPYVWLKFIKRPITDEEKEKSKIENDSHVPKFLLLGYLPLLKRLFGYGFIIYIAFLVMLEINLAKSYQDVMQVNQRNALMSVNVFMTPFYEIFTFIEDITTVVLAFALGRGDKELPDKLVHMGYVFFVSFFSLRYLLASLFHTLTVLLSLSLSLSLSHTLFKTKTTIVLLVLS
jgi:hypothetical protein